MKVSWHATALAICAMGFSNFAAAQTTHAAAEALFRNGREAMDRVDLEAACASFAESQRLDPSPGTLLNLALCEEGRGRLVGAWLHANELLETSSPNDPRVPLAEQLRDRVSPRLAHLTVIQTPTLNAAEIIIDGTVLGKSSFGLSIPVDAGPHRVEATGPGFLPVVLELEVSEGQSKQAAVNWVRAPSDLEARQFSGQASSVRLRQVGWTSVGVGAAALAAGAASLTIMAQRQRALSEHCPDNTCDQQGLSTARAGANWSTMSTVSISAGVFGMALGAVLLNEGRPRFSEAAPDTRRTVGYALAAGGGAGLLGGAAALLLRPSLPVCSGDGCVSSVGSKARDTWTAVGLSSVVVGALSGLGALSMLVPSSDSGPSARVSPSSGELIWHSSF